MCIYFEHKLDTSERYSWQAALGCGDSSKVGISFPMPTSLCFPMLWDEKHQVGEK